MVRFSYFYILPYYHHHHHHHHHQYSYHYFAIKNEKYELKEMLGDPYRDIAYVLKLNGGFKKSAIPFAELIWADFLREHISPPPPISVIMISLVIDYLSL